jgi:hypothetical protein
MSRLDLEDVSHFSPSMQVVLVGALLDLSLTINNKLYCHVTEPAYSVDAHSDFVPATGM